MLAHSCSLKRRSISRLSQVLPDIAALFKSRGLPLSLIAKNRPDILLYSPHTLMVRVCTCFECACVTLKSDKCILDLQPARLLCASSVQKCDPLSLRSSQAKIDSLPSVLELSPRRARDLVVAWPSLLRHSTASLHERYQVRGLCRVKQMCCVMKQDTC